MARTIMAPVGRMGGVNFPQDVTTVQELLNNVSARAGGPSPTLVVDGLCGPKTIAAIQRFQLHHFGWSLADGRVDPNGPTLRKLNELDPAGVPDPFPPLTVRSRMICPHGGQITSVTSSAPVPFGGAPTLRAADAFVIAGCPFVTHLGPSPCSSVRWVAGPLDPLDRRSIGLCFNPMQAPQGPVIIVAV